MKHVNPWLADTYCVSLSVNIVVQYHYILACMDAYIVMSMHMLCRCRFSNMLAPIFSETSDKVAELYPKVDQYFILSANWLFLPRKMRNEGSLQHVAMIYYTFDSCISWLVMFSYNGRRWEGCENLGHITIWLMPWYSTSYM